MSSSTTSTLSSSKTDLVLVELNVGGCCYTTTQELLTSVPATRLASWFDRPNKCPLIRDSAGRYFIDRDGETFRFILEGLRHMRDTAVRPFHLSRNVTDAGRLLREIAFYGLGDCFEIDAANEQPQPQLSLPSPNGFKSQQLAVAAPSVRPATPGNMRSGVFELAMPDDPSYKHGHITVAYHGTFSFGQRGPMQADVNFRKINRIIINGRVSLCREAFGESLNEGRDPDRGESGDRYTARFFLKHTYLEQAFDALTNAGFRMVGHLVASCATGCKPSGEGKQMSASAEEDRWMHYNEFVFCRP